MHVSGAVASACVADGRRSLACPFEKLSCARRKEYCGWIAGLKKEDTRQAQIRKAVEVLQNGVKTPG